MTKRKALKYNPLTQISSGWNLLFTVLLLVGAVMIIAPMLIVFTASLSSKASLATGGFRYIPAEWSLEGYSYMFKMGDSVVNGYMISVGYAGLGTASSLFLMSLYAYVIAQRGFAAVRHFTWFIFITMLFSGGLVPQYILNTRYLNIGNSFWIFILPGLADAWSVIILRTFLRTTVPDSLVDSARIDGAGHFRIYFNIVLPLFKAGLATIGLFGFVSRWNDWFTAFMYNTASDKLYPLQTILYKMQANIDWLRNNSAYLTTPDGIEMYNQLPGESIRLACVVMIVLPILCAYPFFQRFFVRGLLVGSIKE